MWQNLAVGIYPESIAEKARSPKHVGLCPLENGAGISASFVCGSSIRFSIRVEPEAKRIEQITYETNGCGFAVATAEDLVEWGETRKLTELAGIREPVLSVAERPHCGAMVVEGFRSALADHRQRTIQEFKGEIALICTCFGISEDTIVEAIRTQNAANVSEVSAACNAGSGCGSCQMLIQELLDSAADGR